MQLSNCIYFLFLFLFCMVLSIFFFFFFFSSRRRHTRLTCDWSSDVCSSDLNRAGSECGGMGKGWTDGLFLAARAGHAHRDGGGAWHRQHHLRRHRRRTAAEIGRASCRERVEIWVVAGGLKKRE